MVYSYGKLTACDPITAVLSHFLYIIHRKKKGDSFIGRLFYPLRSIPNFGEGKALIIYDHSGKKERGSVTLWLSIGIKEKKVPITVKQAYSDGYYCRNRLLCAAHC